MTEQQAPTEITVENFVAEIIDPSKERLVIVDFWSPRSAVCEKVTPLLEKLIKAEKGAALFSRVNVDKNPQIAQQLRLKSLPTVYAFHKGQILDGFAGLLPESQIKSWLQKLIKHTGSQATDDSEDAESALTQAEQHFKTSDYDTANAIYVDILGYDPDEPRAHAGLIRCLLAKNKLDEAKALYVALPEDIAKDKACDTVRAAIELAEQATETIDTLSELESKIQQNENDHQTRFDLAMAYYGTGRHQDAVEALLKIIKRNRSWEQDKARKQLLKFFDALGQTDPLTIDARKRLSTILFS